MFISILMFITILNLDSKIEIINIQLEKGNQDTKISLKEDAFKVIEDMNIDFENGFNNIEIEKVLDNHKYSDRKIIDGNLEDERDNAKIVNELWGIENGYENLYDIELVFTKNFKDRLGHVHRQHLWQVDWDYFNQRSIPIVGNIICVPSSATMLLKGLGINIEVLNLIHFFKNNPEIISFARNNYNRKIEEFIENNILYQITGVFTYGLNLYLEKQFPNFPYRLDYDYFTIEEVAKYVEVYGLMSATFFPSFVLQNKREDGHMINITKVYKDYNGYVIAFGIVDPFGNPNVAYKGSRGWDGKNVIVGIDTMKKVMKSYHDDWGRGKKDLYRVLFFTNK